LKAKSRNSVQWQTWIIPKITFNRIISLVKSATMVRLANQNSHWFQVLEAIQSKLQLKRNINLQGKCHPDILIQILREITASFLIIIAILSRDCKEKTIMISSRSVKSKSSWKKRIKEISRLIRMSIYRGYSLSIEGMLLKKTMKFNFEEELSLNYFV